MDGPYGPCVRTVRADRPYGRSVRTVRTDGPYGRSVRTVRTDGPYGRSVRTVRTDGPYGRYGLGHRRGHAHTPGAPRGPPLLPPIWDPGSWGYPFGSLRSLLRRRASLESTPPLLAPRGISSAIFAWGLCGHDPVVPASTPLLLHFPPQTPHCGGPSPSHSSQICPARPHNCLFLLHLRFPRIHNFWTVSIPFVTNLPRAPTQLLVFVAFSFPLNPQFFGPSLSIPRVSQTMAWL